MGPGAPAPRPLTVECARGDHDGLWVLWTPMLFFFILVLGLVAGLGDKARERLRRSE